MNLTRRLTVFGLLALLATACADLEVENLNAPDRDRALKRAGDVENLIAGSFLSWFRVDQDYNSGGMALSIMADEATSSWGNSYMREGGNEPRQAIPNSPSHGYAYVFENPWFWDYSAISAVRDGILAIAGEDGILDTDDDLLINGGLDNPRALAFAKFVQGLAHGYLALTYDKGFKVDETIADVSTIEFADALSYAELAVAAVAYLQEAIDRAEADPFTIPSSWVGNSPTLTNSTEMVQLAHSYAARILAGWPRNEAEQATVSWAAVRDHTVAGITADFNIIGDGYVKWYSDYKWCTGQTGWGRTDMRMVGPAASEPVTNQVWRDWLATEPATARQPFMVDTDDERFPTYPPTFPAGCANCWNCLTETNRTATCGLYFEYRDPAQPLRPERGTYHFSGYGDYRHYDYVYDEVGPIMMFNVAENELLKAEAYMNLGSTALAIGIINGTREGNGGLPPVTAAGVPEIGGRCTPRTETGACGNLMEALKYEKRVESYTTGMGQAFWDDRGWGDLVSSTPIQFPIPAQELLTLLQEIYTFGGDCSPNPPGDCGSAPDVVAWSVAEGAGLRPLKKGEVPSPADIAARVAMFEKINASGGRLSRQ